MHIPKFQLRLAFTMIELLVVISIIGLLASIILASINTARAKARDARRIEDIRQIQNALELYYYDFKQYPTVAGDPTCVTPNWDCSYLGSPFLSALVPTYMSQIPMDPINATMGTVTYTYQYWRGSGASGTCLAGRNRYILAVRALETSSGIRSPEFCYTAAVFKWANGSYE